MSVEWVTVGPFQENSYLVCDVSGAAVLIDPGDEAARIVRMVRAADVTIEAIWLTQEAEKLGADGSLQVLPYYNKPTQEGLFQHFRTIARKTRLPIMLYSVPSRCGVEIGVETVSRLARHNANIIGIKEAGGNPDRVSQMRTVLDPRFVIMSGDDSLTLPSMAVGAQGVVSVASNVVPREVSHMVKAFTMGKLEVAQKLHQKFFALFKDLFIETNPIPVKVALAMMGMIAEEYRLPLVPISAKNRETLEATMNSCGALQ